MSTKEMALVYPKSGVGWQASWRLKPRLGGQRVAKPAYAGWVLANGSRRRPTSRRREPPSRRGFNRQLANPRFVMEPLARGSSQTGGVGSSLISPCGGRSGACYNRSYLIRERFAAGACSVRAAVCEVFQGMQTSTSLRDEVRALDVRMVADRRHFHQHPELGFQEHETAAYVAERLRSLGIETQTGVAQTGVVGLIRGRAPGRVVLLRADMDALPLTEENHTPYVSQRPGAHHACGQDGHTAMLLTVAEVLMRRRDEFDGAVKLVFQPAEEGPGGAEPMIAAGVMEEPHVDACFGLHLANDAPVGVLVVRGGALQASADDFEITVQGVGGHGGLPHQTVDAVAIGAAIVNELQRIISREVNPLDRAVVIVGSFPAGPRHNIIAARA